MPPFLEPGAMVRVVGPSGVTDRRRLDRGLAYLRARGLTAILGRHVNDRHGYLAGTDEARAEDLNEAIAANDASAILFSRGGYGLTRILDRLDLKALRRRPRLLLGFSDMTALFMALQRRGPYLVHYGPVVSEMGNPAAFDEKSLWASLSGEASAFRVRFTARDVLRRGRGRGRLIGGCLTLLCNLVGTRFDPDYRDAILFWEEVGEAPYRIDRMLTHLSQAGKLDMLRGMVVGSLTGCTPSRGKPSLAVREILAGMAGRHGFPIVWNVRAGHVAGKITLPLGAMATLDTAGGTLSIRRPGGSPSRARGASSGSGR